MAFDIDAALRYVVEREGSDLHVKVDSPPMARIHGALRPIDGSEPLTEQDTEAALEHILNDQGLLQEFDDRRRGGLLLRALRALAGSASTPFASVGAVSIACRAIPFQVRTIDDLGLPEVIRKLAEEPRGIVLLTGTTGSGQVDDAGGDDRPHQLDPLAPHRHPRGPDRVPAPRQALDHQPARGRPGHGELRPGDAQGPAPGPGRDPDRRDARRGDRAHGAGGRRDGPPRALHPAHPGRDRDDQPDHRLLPAAPPAAGAGDARGDAARAWSRSGWSRGPAATGGSRSAR